MGSRSNSWSNSETNNSNLPITQSGDNPLSLTAAGSDGAQVGGANNINGSYSQNTKISGSTINTLDGGAINKAFDFGSNLVTVLADITKQNNAAAQSQSSAALKGVIEAKKDISEKDAANDILQNKTIIYAVLAVAIAYLYFRK